MLDLTAFLGSTSTVGAKLNFVVVGGDFDGMTIGQGTFTKITPQELTWTLDMKLSVINLVDGTLDLVLNDAANATLTVTYTDIGSQQPVTDVVTPVYRALGGFVYFTGTVSDDVVLPAELGDMSMYYLFSIGKTTVPNVPGTVTQLYARAMIPLRVNMVPA